MKLFYLFLMYWVCFLAQTAHAEAVGLGFGAGVAYSPSSTQKLLDEVRTRVKAGQSVTWGFFVDIPIIKFFTVTPAAAVYQLHMPQGFVPFTDLEMHFKFLIPLAIVKFGAGAILGATTASTHIGMHFGGGAYLYGSILPNIQLFLQAKYQRFIRPEGPREDLDMIHGLAGIVTLF
jgi:hypothetical protein